MTSGKNPVEYIQHHLHNWQTGHGLLLVNLDTLLFSVLCGFAFVILGWWLGRRITSGRPGKVQNALEAVVGFVNQQIKDTFPVQDPYIGPVALTVFLWVALMNAMDLVPVDLVPRIAQWVGHYGFGLKMSHVYMRLLPTSDLDVPLALALSVFALMVIYNIRAKGLRGYVRHFLTHPYGAKAAPANLVMSLLEEFAKPLSLALRLWGNMFAGELIFMLIALFGFSLWVAVGQVTLDFLWSWFETLVVLLQAFIFMLLTIVYLAMAAESDQH